MAEPELTLEEIANYCNLPIEQVIDWAEQGILVARPAACVPDSRVKLSSLITCLDQQGIALPDRLKSTSKRVLIIDDDRSMANALQRVLRRAGYETFVAEDGFTAGSLLERLDPVLVTLDLSMPGLDGFDVLRYIRHQPRYRTLKVLVISALPDSQLQRAMDLGANDVLSKPFDNVELQQRIAQLISQSAELCDG